MGTIINIIIAAAAIAAVIWTVRSIIKNKGGCASCRNCSNCAGCPQNKNKGEGNDGK